MGATKTISGAVQSAVAGLLAELYGKASCEKIGLTRESFGEILCEVAAKYLPPAGIEDDRAEKEARTFLLTLRVEELALARACAAGSNAAWGNIPDELSRKAVSGRAAHCPRRFFRARSCRQSLCRAVWHSYARGRTGFKTRFVYRAWVAGGLATHSAGAGVCEPLPPHQTPGQP